VEDKTGVQYDSVLCNQYRSGKDSVAYHCDCEAEMSSVHPIASVSLGAERVFQMKSKDSRFTEKMTLGNGSLLIMQAGMQTTWEHAVPKTAKNIGGRINLTFRVMVTDS
jgi:alkylated DNA repair dioxygenase AlkB